MLFGPSTIIPNPISYLNGRERARARCALWLIYAATPPFMLKHGGFAHWKHRPSLSMLCKSPFLRTNHRQISIPFEFNNEMQAI